MKIVLARHLRLAFIFCFFALFHQHSLGEQVEDGERCFVLLEYSIDEGKGHFPSKNQMIWLNGAFQIGLAPLNAMNSPVHDMTNNKGARKLKNGTAKRKETIFTTERYLIPCDDEDLVAFQDRYTKPKERQDTRKVNTVPLDDLVNAKESGGALETLDPNEAGLEIYENEKGLETLE